MGLIDWIASWRRRGTHAVRQAAELRRALTTEQQQLALELERTMMAYRARLERFAHNMASMNDDAMEREKDFLRETQAQLRRAIKRIGLVERETQELMHEWEDWEQAAFAGAARDPLAEERREMVRSELAVRGKMKKRDAPLITLPASVNTQSMRQHDDRLHHALAPHDATQTNDALDDWDEDLDALLMGSSSHAMNPFAHPHHQLQAVKRFRHQSGERKRIDRLKGITRDRLSPFPF